NYVAGFREDKPHEVVQVEKPPLPDIAIDDTLQSAFARDILALPVTPIEPVFLKEGLQYEKETEEGYVFYYTKNPVNDVFVLSIVVDFGTRQNNRMPIAERLLQRTGTAQLTAEELQMAWYKLGTSFSINVKDNQTVVSLSGLDSEFDASVALLMEMLDHPKIDEEAFEELKKIIEGQWEDIKKNPQQISSALVEFNRCGSEAAYLSLPSSRELYALTALELQELLRKAFSHTQQVLYTGSLPRETVVETVKRHRLGTEVLAAPSYYLQQVREPESDEVFFLNRDMAQSHVRMEFGSIPYDPAISAAVQLYNMYFAGGMAGVVFQELREVRALAYVVGARYVPGARRGDRNIMVGVIQTQTDKTVEAVTAFTE
ncbi:MAG: insulinase family protein, partial [Candidatus Hydrogenedentes bacterium]|nr:insulinase family protein [Candidatus Hydrogenedentota bacterium]